MTEHDEAAMSGWEAFVAWLRPTKPTKRWSLYWYPRGEENEFTRAIDREKAEYDEWQWQHQVAQMAKWLEANGLDKETLTFAELREAYTEYQERGWHDKYY